MLYRAYVTDGIKIITDTLNAVYGGSTLNDRYWNLINAVSKNDAEQIEEDAEQVIARILSTAQKLKESGGEVDGRSVDSEG